MAQHPPSANGTKPGDENNSLEALTQCIRSGIHYAATRDATDEGNELDQLEVQNS